MTMAMSNNSEIIAEMFLPSISERNSKFKAHFPDFSSFFPQIQTHTFIIFYLIPQLSMSWAQMIIFIFWSHFCKLNLLVNLFETDKKRITGSTAALFSKLI